MSWRRRALRCALLLAVNGGVLALAAWWAGTKAPGGEGRVAGVAGSSWRAPLVLSCCGFSGALWCLAIGRLLCRGLLTAGYGALAVARLTFDEGSSRRGLAGVAVLLLALLAFLPLGFDPEVPLRYRVQSYLSYALGLSVVLLSCGTIFFATRSVTGEVEGQVGGAFVKPLRRGSYLLGKCCGLALVNLLLVSTAGAVTYFVARHHLGEAPALDAYDAAALKEDVLTARRVVRPQEPSGPREEAARELEELLERTPEHVEHQGGRAVVLKRLVAAKLVAARSLAPGASSDYRFVGLDEARRLGETFQLRCLVQMIPLPKGGHAPLAFTFPGGHRERRVLKVGSSENLTLPTALIDDGGELGFSVTYDVEEGSPLSPAATLSIPPRDGLVALYVRGSFGGNVTRVFTVLWVHLSFLGTLGVAAATFLSFAVAAFSALVFWVLAALGSVLLRVLERLPDHRRGARGLSGLYDRYVADFIGALARLFQEYSRLDAGERLIEGQHIAWSDILPHVLWIGAVWTGACLLLGWAILRRREVARVQV